MNCIEESGDSVCIVSAYSTTKKRRCVDSVTTTESKKRNISYSTYLKWQSELDKECQTLSWLDCSLTGKEGKKTVDRLKCTIYSKYNSRIHSMRNYSKKWVVGADSVRTNNVRDHARSDQHRHAMSLHYKESGSTAKVSEPSSSDVCTMLQRRSERDQDRLRKQFDIAYFVATHKLAFSKYKAICNLESSHGVDIGTSYVNENAGKTFCKFIAKARMANLCTSTKFLSILMDGQQMLA